MKIPANTPRRSVRRAAFPAAALAAAVVLGTLAGCGPSPEVGQAAPSGSPQAVATEGSRDATKGSEPEARNPGTEAPGAETPATETPEPSPGLTAGDPLYGPGFNDTSIDCSKVKCVALTFDDGPGDYTQKLLDILKANDAKASFFLLGKQVKQYPELAVAEVEAGMDVGNHSWDHPVLSMLPWGKVQQELVDTSAQILAATGHKPSFLRPPYGSLTKTQRKRIDLPLAFWNVDTLDWQTHSTSATVAAASAAKPGDIILMHDIHPWTVDAVDQIAKNLKAKGYHLVTLTTLLGGKPELHLGYGHGLRPKGA